MSGPQKIGAIIPQVVEEIITESQKPEPGQKYEALERDWRKEREDERLAEIMANPERFLLKAGIGRRFLNAKLDGLKLAPPHQAAVEEFLGGEADGLFITGAVGTGKTHLACAVARERVISGVGVQVQSAPALFQDIRSTFNGAGNEGEIIRRFSDTTLFVLDDLGAEKGSDFTVDRLYLIVDARYADRRQLIVTSNLTLDQIAERVHDRLASRFAEMCRVIRLTGNDRRIRGNQ